MGQSPCHEVPVSRGETVGTGEVDQVRDQFGDSGGAIQDIDPEAEGTEPVMAVQLERTGFFPRSLELHEGSLAAGQQDEPVRDAAHARTHELQAHATEHPDGEDEFVFNIFF